MKPLEKARQDLEKAKKKRDASKKRLEADEFTVKEYHSVQRAFMYQDKILSSLDAQGSHTVHPVGYFNGR